MSNPGSQTTPPRPPWAGRLITIDGVDGAGKSTQIQRLVKHLQRSHHDVVSVRDPGSTEVGTRLRELLLNSDLELHRRTEAMLFMASRCEMLETIIEPALASEKTVVSDRFLLSNVVYQSIGSADGRVLGVPADILWQLGRLACGDRQPDLTILLDVPAEVSMARLAQESDRMESRGVDYMRSVREAYLREVPRAGRQHVVLDATQTIDQVSQQILRLLQPNP